MPCLNSMVDSSSTKSCRVLSQSLGDKCWKGHCSFYLVSIVVGDILRLKDSQGLVERLDKSSKSSSFQYWNSALIPCYIIKYIFDFWPFGIIKTLVSFFCSLMPRPHPWGEGLVTFSWFLRLCYKFIAYSLLYDNLCAKKVLCHRTEVAKNFWCCTTDCAFCNVIGGGKILSRK